MKVPFLDLKAQYRQIKAELDPAIQDVINNTAFVMGRYLQRFEEEFAAYQNIKHVLGTNSGTSALASILMALKKIHGAGWGNRWEVILPANTFIATAEAVIQAGGVPVFTDIIEKTYNIDPDKVESVLTGNSRVVIPVHLYGQPAHMTAVMEIAKKHNLIVVEDAAQAHGARYLNGDGNWQRLGGFGSAAGFSFYPGKNLGAYGDGGAIGTNDAAIAEFVKMYRDHGSKIKYEHQFAGSTDRLDSLQAEILRVKLKYLDEWNAGRRANAELYKKYFADVDEVIIPHVPEWAEPVWHLFVIRVKNRIDLQSFLQENEIGSGFHYKYPLHLQDAFAYLNYKKGDFPVTEKVMDEIISPPMFPELTEEQIKYVVEKVKEFLYRHKDN
jgi:dTDP-4-amino-4,6-dideoxygalactose transaminase